MVLVAVSGTPMMLLIFQFSFCVDLLFYAFGPSFRRGSLKYLETHKSMNGLANQPVRETVNDAT